MAGLIRQGHFLGTKLRSLRRRNGLTLDELSARCVQIDASGAPSVSYLSMVETGKRMPSAEMLRMLAGIFSKDARWFLDENTEVDIAPAQRERGGLAAMPLEPAFLFSHELLQNALPELLSQTGTTGRQFAQLLIRVWQETRHNNFPDIERAAEECGKRQMPLTLDAVMAICQWHGLKVRWFDGDGRKPNGGLVRSQFEAPGTVLINERLRNQEERLKYDLAFFIGHKILHNGDGAISPHSASQSGDGDASGGAAGMGARDVLHAWREFECSFFAGALLCPRPQARRDTGTGHAPHDRRVALPALAFLRCLPARLLACGVPRQRHPFALGQYEPGLRSLSTMGGVSPVAAGPGRAGPAGAEVANFGHAGRQARAIILLPFPADPRRAR
jgi:transcriptional regulator with XRE-family HTH domain